MNNGGSWSSSGGITVGEIGKGMLRVAPAGTVQCTSLDDSGGTVVGRGRIKITNSSGTIITPNSGVIQGTLDLIGNVDSSGGDIEPGQTGASPGLGTLTIDGTADLGGELDIDVFGGQGGAAATCDLLAVNGPANLTGGTLHVDFLGGSLPGLNTHLVVLTASGSTEDTKFASSPEGSPVGNGYYWHVDYSNPDEVILMSSKQRAWPSPPPRAFSAPTRWRRSGGLGVRTNRAFTPCSIGATPR